jgi:putative membrane protein insertion efficiency factor
MPRFVSAWATALARLPQRLLLVLVQGYRLFFKAWVGSACRFEPSCSAYAMQALQQHGAARGGLLVATRLLRCHPYCAGGCDPVPSEFKNPAAGLFSRLGLHQVDVAADTPPIRK